MPKEVKQLSYKKCEQCRKDRQKCLPEGRTWPGRRCDRCLKYGYNCSASRVKSQELAKVSHTSSGSKAPQDVPSLPDHSLEEDYQRPRSEVQCLQDLGDIRQVIVCYLELNQDTQNTSDTVWLKTLRNALQGVVKETEAWALQHETDGRYKDAAYLYGRIHSDLKMESRIVPTLAAVYEKLGDLPAAELAQAQLMDIIFVEGWEESNEERIREVARISRLFSLFHKRLQVLGPASQTYANLSIVYRAAALDLEQLNTALFEQGLIVLNSLNQWNCCSLHIAVKKKAPNLVRLLLRNGANPDLKNDVGATPLHTAVRNGAGDIVQLLLNHGANTEIRDPDGNTAVHTALLSSQDIAILSHLFEKNADIQVKDLLGRTPLCNAIVSNSPTIARYLIKHGADVDALCDASNTLGTLLFEAVRQKREWAVNLLLDGGADLKARDSIGRTVLYYAVRRGQESVVKVLLGHGATETATTGPVSNSGSTLLHCAMIKPNVNIVKMILKAGVDVNGQDLVGDTALHMLIRTGQPPLEQMVNLLVNLGAQVNIGNNEGDTPLHLAVGLGRQEIGQILLRAGADPQRTNFSGDTPLAMAREQSLNSSHARDIEMWKTLGCHVWDIRNQNPLHTEESFGINIDDA